LRKLAVLVRGFDREIRAGLLSAIHSKDSRAGEIVAKLMIIWADIPHLTDKSLQKILKRYDAKKLALAIHKADEVIMQKVKSNLSERAIAALEKEASLISAPRDEDIEGARSGIVKILREMNEKSEDVFMEVYDEVTAGIPGIDKNRTDI